MKYLFFLLIFGSVEMISQTSTPETPGVNLTNWNLVFQENFNYQNTADIDTKWKRQHGEKRYLTEQVFQKDRVILGIEDTIRVIKLQAKYHNEGIQNPDYWNNLYKNANGKIAKYSTGEIITNKKFLYGCIEARIKLPVGRGLFPGFWLMPTYRERQFKDSVPTNWNFDGYMLVGKRYPEEIDIIEQRSYFDPGTNTFNNHIYDFCMFFNDSTSGYKQAVDKVHYFEDTSLAGEWHTYSVKWDMFGQHYYIDGVHKFSNDLWSRSLPSHAESMNVIIGATIITNTSDSSQNPTSNSGSAFIDNTVIGSPTRLVSFADDFGIDDEEILIDWVRVYQEKKFNNPVVWTSGQSDKLGEFDFKNVDKLPIQITGNFITDDLTVADGDEIFIFSRDGLRSSLQRLTNKTTTQTLDLNTGQNISKTHHDVWEVKTIGSEIRESIGNEYMLNNWFIPSVVARTNYAVGDFDGVVGDELFITNDLNQYAVLMKFANTQNTTTLNYYLYNELYNNQTGFGTNKTIRSSNGTTNITRDFNIADKFIAGNFDINDTKDELLWINPLQKKLSILKYNGTGWQNLLETYAANGVVIGTWTVSVDDYYLAGNFDNIPGSNDELLCFNKATGLIHLYRLNISSGTWTKIWDNANTGTSTTPLKINDWWTNPSDEYLAGDYLGNGNTQLLCISRNGGYGFIYEFSFNQVSQNCVLNTKMQNINNERPELSKYISGNYSYVNKDEQITNTLFTMDLYKKCHELGCYDYRYSTTLTSFADALSPTPWTSTNRKNNVGKLENSDIEEQIYVFPNPSNGKTSILFNKKLSGQLLICSNDGKIIQDKKISEQKSLELNLGICCRWNIFCKSNY
ncbi:family 16 glycosylhydrolase [Flavobacterium sp. J372]|uniref:glycoside hydrolase family 16 protein n=1 Tax=Flavobacterium sp. J372 TaxID=2898436 RepID=UPI002151F24B|nr:family 16 glycosylhydrolase [Flavobacterium sp. J372]MCR5862825.1 family 16 glycosylhydrolase [Flavobacterium sp. J372]